MYLTRSLYLLVIYHISRNVFYNAYCYKKCCHLDICSTILKSLVGFIVFSALVLRSFILGMVLAFFSAFIANKLGYNLKGFFEANFA